MWHVAVRYGRMRNDMKLILRCYSRHLFTHSPDHFYGWLPLSSLSEQPRDHMQGPALIRRQSSHSRLGDTTGFQCSFPYPSAPVHHLRPPFTSVLAKYTYLPTWLQRPPCPNPRPCRSPDGNTQRVRAIAPRFHRHTRPRSAARRPRHRCRRASSRPTRRRRRIPFHRGGLRCSVYRPPSHERPRG